MICSILEPCSSSTGKERSLLGSSTETALTERIAKFPLSLDMVAIYRYLKVTSRTEN
jgi:hypothetical protein